MRGNNDPHTQEEVDERRRGVLKATSASVLSFPYLSSVGLAEASEVSSEFLYASNWRLGRRGIDKVSFDGTVSTVFDSTEVKGFTAAPDGTFWATEQEPVGTTDFVRHIDDQGNVLEEFDSQTEGPRGIAIDDQGVLGEKNLLYLVAHFDSELFKFDQDGNLLDSFRLFEFNIDGISIDDQGFIWLVSPKLNTVYKTEISGGDVSVVDSWQPDLAAISGDPEEEDVRGIAVIGSDVWVSSGHDGRNIYRFNKTGEFQSLLSDVEGRDYLSSPPTDQNVPPTAAFDFMPEDPVVDEEVTFDASGSSDPDGTISTFQWDFDGDGIFEKTGEQVKHKFSTAGEFPVTLRVTDDDGATDEVTKTVTIEERARLQLSDVRLVQTVENTKVVERNDENKVTNILYDQQEDPDIVANRNAAIVFNIEAENLSSLPESVNGFVRPKPNPGNKLSFSLSKDDIEAIHNGTDPLVVFHQNTTDEESKNDLPVFNVDENLKSVEVAIGTTDRVLGHQVILQEGAKGNQFTFSVAPPQKLNVGFIQIKDPESGENYGLEGKGTPMNYKNTVEKTSEYLLKVFPVSDLNVYREDTPIRGTEDANNVAVSGDAAHVHQSHNPDQPENQCADELDCQRAHSELVGALPVDANVFGGTITEDDGFDVTVVVVPGADPKAENDDWFSFHGDNMTTGREYKNDSRQPQTSAVMLGINTKLPQLDDQGNHVTDDEGDPIYLPTIGQEQTGAQEIGHHFTNEPYEGPVLAPQRRTHPLAQRDDNGAELIGFVDWDHARHLDSNLRSGQPEDRPGVESTGFDFTDGKFKVKTDLKFPNHNKVIIVDRLQSYMSYKTSIKLWADTRIYQELIRSNFEPHPPVEDLSPERDILKGCAWVSENGKVKVANLSQRVSRPTPDVTDGEVSFESFDPNEESLDKRNIPDRVEILGNSRGGDPKEVDEGTILFTLPFPDEVNVLRIEREETLTSLNPIERLVRDAIKGIPDSGFKNRPNERRQALFNKLDALNKQMEEENFRAAKRKMTRDVRNKLEKWLKDRYDAAANELTKQEILELVDDMINRLETLAQISDNQNNSNNKS